MSYWNLHTHTHYSNTRILDCINKEDALIDYAHKIGLSGVAITDHENLSAHGLTIIPQVEPHSLL